uniref:Uncharacterized protein n=1 Tax=Brassica oleracea var. oleracea TaxID=109376 RepID=A0A0D3CTF5_BRAOL
MERHLCFDPGTTSVPLTSDIQEYLFVLSIQEIQVQPLRNESIDRAQKPEIWRSFVVQTSYLGDASDRGSVKNGYLNIPNVFCHESNFPGNPTHLGFTEVWNHFKIFTEKGVMNFPNRRFSSLSIREYQTSKGDSGPRKKWPEPKPILNESKDKHHQFPRRASTGERLRTCVRGTWNRTYLRETSSNLQGSTMDLRTNPFEEGGNDVPQSTDQYMELAQHGIQDVLNISTEVHVFHRNGQTDRAVYLTVPHAFEKELWLEPWSDDRSDLTGACLSRPTSHSKTIDHARLDKEHARLDLDHARLDLDHEPNLTKARIFHLSEDIGHTWSSMVHDLDMVVHTDSPTSVVLLTAVHASGYNESGQKPNSHLV